VTANIPTDVLARAQRATGKGITETLVEGLDLLRRRAAGERILAMAGRLKLDVDVDASRERTRR
jgi:hypothetical protein